MEQITFEEFGKLLDEVTEALPKEIFVNLNGGVNLLPDIINHPEDGGLFVLGHYHQGGHLGRYINIYYGSFMQLYGNSPREYLRRQIDKVLRHEFLHHLESMAGEKDLEIQDAIDLARYRRKRL